MKTNPGRHSNRHWYCGLLVMLLSIAGLISPIAKAQQATATVTGVVKDPSGASIANAQVALTNVNTGVVRKTTTNSDGVYDFPSVVVQGARGRPLAAFGPPLLWHDCREGLSTAPSAPPPAIRAMSEH